jgi:type IV pilus assembly protein PilB
MKIPKKLGELLVENGLLTEAQLVQAIEAQKGTRKLLGVVIVEKGFASKEKLEATLAQQYGSVLGEILISKGYITFNQLQSAMVEQRGTLKTLGEVLIDKGYATEMDIMDGLSKQYNIPFVKLSQYEIDPDAVGKVPLDALRKYCVFPINVQDNMLVVATANPEDFLAESDLKFLSGMYIKFVLAARSELLSFLE